ncbi:SRPBCC domain-containing protein, partial [Rhizobium ruizarguesonis]
LKGHEGGWSQSFERLGVFLGAESEGTDHE